MIKLSDIDFKSIDFINTSFREYLGIYKDYLISVAPFGIAIYNIKTPILATNLPPFKNNIYFVKYLKKINEASENLKTVEFLDEYITDVFCALTDNGFEIEVLHQNGYATYQVFHKMLPSFMAIYSSSMKYDILDDIRRKRYVEIADEYTKLLSVVNSELDGVVSKLQNTPGFNGFNFNLKSLTFEISFKHIQQGFGNLGSVKLIGDSDITIYAKSTRATNN